MTIVVSRGTMSRDGQKLCSRCGRRPPARDQRWCRPCHAEYMRDWRSRTGKTEMLLTPEERELVLAVRRDGLAGQQAP